MATHQNKTLPKTSESPQDDRKVFVILVLCAIVATLVFVFWPKETASQSLSPRAAFAACLTDKGVTMYGTDTCPNCQTQKGMFQNDFSRIHYVNCDIHQDECQQMGITGTPTWIYNGQRLQGVQTFPNLSKLSSCAAP